MSDNKISLLFIGELDSCQPGGFKTIRLTKEGFCYQDHITDGLQHRIVKALNLQVDEEIVVTFIKRKKS